MLLNKVLFPAPKPPHYTLTSHIEHLFWLPPQSANQLPIPCMFYAPKNIQRKVEYFMIFCHGNGCDIGTMDFTLTEFSKSLNIYIINFEYPTYGLCTTSSPNQQTINNHADRTINFVHNNLKWPLNRIIVYGHSIGSGSACYLASTRPIGALILQSPYTAINNLVKEKIGLLSIFINTHSWNNLEAMKDIFCPVLFIHGLNDTLIPSDHSRTLHEACKNMEGKKLILLRFEDHNSISETMLLKYIIPFLEKQYKMIDKNLDLPIVRIDDELRQTPNNIKDDRNRSSSTSNSSDGGLLNDLFTTSRNSIAAAAATIERVSGKNNVSNSKE